MTAEDRHDLKRFVEAQDHNATYALALLELRSGRKASHWMWFVFPQIAGLGMSTMSQRYAISGLDEARAYWAHPVLGERYRECVRVLLDSGANDPVAVFGTVDAMKLQSSLSLFALVTEDAVLHAALDRFFAGEHDQRTIDLAAELGR